MDEDAILRIQIPPPPLPISWGRTVQPYVPPYLHSQPQPSPADSQAGPFSRSYQVRFLTLPNSLACNTFSKCSQDLAHLSRSLFSRSWGALVALKYKRSGTPVLMRVQAILINPGWMRSESAAAPASDAEKVAALAALDIPRLCPVGFVFVWADKSHLHPVVRQARPVSGLLLGRCHTFWPHAGLSPCRPATCRRRGAGPHDASLSQAQGAAHDSRCRRGHRAMHIW